MSEEEKEEKINSVVREFGHNDAGEHVYKICIVGEPAVGKTSLIRQFVKNQFEVKHIKTIGVDISKQQLILEDNTKINLLFWDLAGQIHFHLLHKVYLNGATGVIIAFDLTRPKTLENAESWYRILENYDAHTVPLILSGNKSDLKDERKVDETSIKKQMEHLGIKDYIETSALNDSNIKELFDLIANRVHNK